MKSYKEKLKDPRWQKKRLLVMDRDDFRCCNCGRDDIELNVHHKQYYPGRNPWEYRMSDLETLCKKCHAYEHNILPTDDYGEKTRNKKTEFRKFPQPLNKIPNFEEIRAMVNALNKKNTDRDWDKI